MADLDGDGFDDETGAYVGPRSGFDLRYGGGFEDPEANVSDFDSVSADIPIWGWLTGASARRDAARAEQAEARNRNIWGRLGATAPDEGQLRVRYDEEREIGPQGDRLREGVAGIGPDAGSVQAQRQAMSSLHDIYSNGGMTTADRARMAQGRQEVGQQMRATREADASALEARGMGGSGAMMASLLGAQQQGAQAMAQREGQMQIAAQDRSDRALGQYGAMAGAMRAQGFDEESTRRGAYDDFYRQQEDYLRGREGRNVGLRNRTRESRRDAAQQAYENRERIAAGMTGQYGTDVSRRQAEGARQDENNRSLLGGIGSLLADIA